MKHIVGAFCTLMVFMLNCLLCISVMRVSGEITEAKEFKADVIAEIENSNFNSNVVDACVRQAQSLGYQLQVTNCTYDERNKINTAEVILVYQYEIPFLGIFKESTTRGMAR